VASLK